MLTSLIYFNQVEIIQYIQKNDNYTNALFQLYEIEEDQMDMDSQSQSQTQTQTQTQTPATPSPFLRKKRDGVRFVHQMSIVAKSFQLPQRAILYANFIRHGLFSLIDFALKDELLSIRILGSELMVTIIEQDPNLVRHADDKRKLSNDINSENENTPPSAKRYNEKVINVLIDLLNDDEDLGLKSQAAEGLKVLLDIGGNDSNTNNYTASLSLSNVINEQQQRQLGDDFESQFYSKSAPRLFSKLIKLSLNVNIPQQIENAAKSMSTIEGRASYEQLCDLLSFCIRQHRVPCRNFVINNNLWVGISRLIALNQKQVRLSAIRCLKQGTLTDDIYYIRSICGSDAIGSLLDVLISMGHQNNLIHSSCLELLTLVDSISTQQTESRRPVTAKEIINHLVDNYKEKLLKLKDTEIAQSIINHYEESHTPLPLPAGRMDSSLTEADSSFEEENSNSSRYTFITSTNNDKHNPSSSAAAAAAAAVAFGLVDYDEDDDDDDEEDEDMDYDNTNTITTRLKRQSSTSSQRLLQHRRVVENEDHDMMASDQTNGSEKTSSSPSPSSSSSSSSASAEKKKNGGHLRRTLATASKKLSISFKRDKDKAVTSD